MQSGLSAQIGYAIESTYGTYATVDRFMPLVSESLTTERARVESAGILAGRRVRDSDQWQAGNTTVSGSIAHELDAAGLGRVMLAMFGAVSTTGAGPYTHTYTPGDLTDDSLSVQIGRPDTGGTVRPFTYTGVVVNGWEIAVKPGELATLGLDVVAQAETTSESLETASYAASPVPFAGVHAAVTVGGGSVNVRELKVAGTNGQKVDRRFVGSHTIAQPLPAELRTYTGELVLEFEDLTEHTRFVDADEFALVVTLTSGTSSLTITTNARYDGVTPLVEGTDVLTQTVPFVCVGSTDAAAITAALVNADATP